MELSDEALVASAQAGDGEASELLYARYKSLVRARARRYYLIGGDGDDLLQEGMIGLYKAVRDYAPERGMRFHSFAELCIKRQLITAVQAATRQKHLPLNSYISIHRPAFDGEEGETLQFSERLMTLSMDPEAEVIAREQSAHMERLLSNSLTSFEQQVLTRFLEGKSYRDIASELGRGTKAVDNALQRIKKKAVEALGNEVTY